jgi:hypothetical protein
MQPYYNPTRCHIEDNLNFFWKWKTTSIFQKFKTTLIFSIKKDDLNFSKMEDILNPQRQPNNLKQWKLKNGCGTAPCTLVSTVISQYQHFPFCDLKIWIKYLGLLKSLRKLIIFKIYLWILILIGQYAFCEFVAWALKYKPSFIFLIAQPLGWAITTFGLSVSHSVSQLVSQSVSQSVSQW